MIELNDSTTVPANNLCTGLLATHLDGFATLLDGQSYAPATVRQKNDLLADFGAWLAEHDVPLEVLGEAHAGQFLTEYHRRTRRGDAWTIRQLIRYLRDIGRIPVLPPEAGSTAEGELASAFGRFLRAERGLSVSTLANYLPIVRSFLDEQFGGKALQFGDLRAADIHRFIVRRAQAASHGCAKLVVTALRSFLRFLQQRGLLATDLAAAVPGVAGWRLAHLPKALPAEQVELLLAILRSRYTGRSARLRGSDAARAARSSRRRGRSHDPRRSRLGMRRDRRAWNKRSAAGAVASADGCWLSLGRLSASRSTGLRDTSRLHSDTRAETRLRKSFGHLLHHSSCTQARRLDARVQGRTPAAPLARHRPAAPRRLACGDRPAPSPQSAAHATNLCQSGHRGIARDRAALARSRVMSPLQVALDEYLAARRALGHKLRLAGGCCSDS